MSKPNVPSDDAPISLSTRKLVRPLAAEDSQEAFSSLLDRVRKDVDARLAGYLDARVADAERHGSDVQAMAHAIRELTLRGGKRLRAALVLVGFLAPDADQPDELALDAGVAFELLQTYLLVHDDWMDNDERRRGGPSVPAMLRSHHGSRELGDAAAVLAGDYAAALAIDVLSRLDAKPERLVRALSLFAEIQQDVICGQQLDIAGTSRDIESHYALKTGSYTVRGPLVFGAILAGASPQVMSTLSDIAAPLGVAFQIRDDLLGAFGDPERTGKPVGEDLRRGKQTIVARMATAKLAGDDLRRFKKVFGNKAATDAQVREVCQLLAKCGIKDAVTRRLEELLGDALDELTDAPISECSRTWLTGAASTIAFREH